MRLSKLIRPSDLMLAGMIGAAVAFNVAVYAIARSALTPPFSISDAVVRVWSPDNRQAPASLRTEQLKVLPDSGVFDAVTAVMPISLEVGDRGAFWTSPAAAVSVDFWRIFDLEPARGRLFGRSDDVLADRLTPIVISHNLWQTRFGADPAVVDRTILIGGRPAVVIGVAPEFFRYPQQQTDVWTVLPSQVPVGVSHQTPVVGRLMAGVAPNAAASVLTSRLAPTLSNESVRVESVSRFEAARVRPYLLVLRLLGAMLALLAIGNVCCLVWSRHVSAARDTAIRVAIGASGRHILRHELGRAWIVAGAALLFGGGFAAVGFQMFEAYGSTRLGWMGSDVTFRGWVLRAAIGSFAAACLAGALVVSLRLRQARAATIQDARAAGMAARTRRLLLFTELALPFVILPVSIVLLAQLLALVTAGERFLGTSLTAVRVSLPEQTYSTSDQQVALLTRLLASLEHHHALRTVSSANVLPLAGYRLLNTVKDADQPYSDESMSMADVRIVSAELFAMLRLQLAGGRFLEDEDRMGQVPSVVIDEGFARQVFGMAVQPGRQVTLGLRTRAWRVVGIVEPVRESLDLEALPTVWVSYRQLPAFSDSGRFLRSFWLIFDPASDGAPKAVREVVEAMVPGVKLSDPMPLSSLAYRQIAAPVTYSSAAAATSALALVIALAGIHGVVAWTVQTMRRELAIRSALGATSLRQVWVCVRDIVIALPLALSAGWLAGYLLSLRLGGTMFTDAPIGWSAALAASALVVLSGLSVALWRPVRAGVAASPLALLRCE